MPDAPAGAENVVFTFGYTEAGNNWWWAIDNIEYGNYAEDFEGVVLGPNIEEGRGEIPLPVDNVWTKEPPAGWTIEDEVPGQDEEDDLNGVTEWIGWSFTDKDWWIGVSAGRHTWRTVPKPVQLRMVRHVLSFGPENGSMTMSEFDAVKPGFMPGSGSHTKTLSLSWQQLNDWSVEL